MNLGSSPLSNITNTVDARQSAQKMQANNNKRQLSLDGFLVNKKQKTGADENVLLSPDTKDKVNKIREIMPELPTKKVVAALKRSNSNIEAATIDLLDDILTAGKDVDTSFESVNNAVDLSNDHDLSDPVIDEHSSTNKLVQQVKELVPQASIEGIRGALDACQNNIEEAVDLLLDIKPYESREQKSVQPIDKRAWDNAEVIDLTSPQPPLKVSQKIVVPNSPLLRRNNTIYGSDEAEEDNNIDEEDEQDRDLFADDFEDEVVMYSPPPNTKTFNKKMDINTKRRLIVEEDDDDSLSEIDENYIGHIPGLNLAPNKEDEGEYQLKNMLARLLEAQDLAELAETPADLKVSLYDYQKQGLAWLLKREKSRPAGGILADQMGLGKTVQLISLILANRPEIDNTTWISIKRNSGSFEVSGRKKLNNDRKATLIVCPTSCVNQWYKEVTSKTRTGSLTARIHYGNTRVKKAEQLCQYDVVITTYGVIANESPEEPSKWGPTRLVKWFRIILDEAHNVRNQNTKSFKSCYNLDSQMRWCVTGTPIQNKIEDLQSLMKIIRYEYGDINNWKASIGSKDGHKRIQGILSPILLCRTKNTKFLGKPIIELPARNVVIREIELADTEGVEYKQLEEQSKNKFNDYLRAGLVKNFQNVLTLLLRLRQMCDHPYLVKRNLLSSSGSDLSQKNFDSDICSICFDVPEEPTYTPCGHLFCKQCLYGEFEKDIDAYEQTLCPTCKTFVTEDKLLSPTKKKQISKTSHLNQSTKIRALMEELNKAKKTDPKFKAIIFSQWTSMLDLVEASLNQDKWKYGRLDGEMLLNHRTAELERFKKTSDCNLLLMSLKVGGVGLNVTEANYVYLLDPWWNPAIEEQAIDRVHRVGQKKPVHVVRFIIKDSVEKRILALQEKKRAIADGALGASQSSASRLTERDLMELFA